ncbi:endonuclease iii--gpd superfamily base excision dna repair [Phytophthora cinnamomi]|uniref:endonuclease iii--gpd superfamily base excision dna repair n=1 Tax=Phytophthora cinnamomi TaxID=4785 RepID=UPI003559CC97|nr:endonuclease iii--gpd superfamily base excision dna repair [Phytophthora cinnamomi]
MRLRSSGPADADASLESKPVVVKVEAERQPSTSRPSRRRIKAQESVGVKREKVEKVEQDAAPPTPKKRAKKIKERVPRQEPSGWREILRGIEEMRANKDAEVDKYGCEVFFDESFPPHVCRFHVLIAAMMSSQTKDPVNAAAMGRLIKHGLTVESMLEIDQQELAQLIRPVGFFNHKAKYIKQTSAILTKQAEVEGNDIVDIPNTYEGLVALPGVGPKMSTLVMNCAWKNTVGICVDTHVHRISNRLKWVKTWNKNNPKSQDPEKTRAELEDWLPKEHWGPINPLLVGFGQTICLPRGPRCDNCKIRGICPSANSSAI